MMYTLILLNHLGEASETHHLVCDDDAHAIACGRELLHKGYPVEITQENRRVRLLKPAVVIFDDFIRHLVNKRTR